MKPKMKKLKNGLRIVTVPMVGNPTVTVLVMVAAGTRYETRATNGLSHFLEHMCFKGTEKRGCREIAYELEAMGAETNAFTDYDYTGYYAKGRAELFPKLLDVVSDVYLNSNFPETELEKERGVICGEIDMVEDDPKHKIGYLLAESLYGEQPAGYTILGPKENIKTFSRNDFVKYRNDHYVAQKTVIIVVGNVTSAKVGKEVARAFGKVKTGKVLKKKPIGKALGKTSMVLEKPLDQAHLQLGIRSVAAGHPDYTALRVMNAVFGVGMSSRLFVKLREEMGAGYYVSSQVSGTDDSGDFAIATGTEPKRVGEVVSAIRDEIKRMRTETVPAKELEKAKEYLIGRTYMGLEATDALAYAVGLQTVYNRPLKLPKDMEKEMRKITDRDVLRVARKYLDPKKFHVAMIGPAGIEQGLQKILSA